MTVIGVYSEPFLVVQFIICKFRFSSASSLTPTGMINENLILYKISSSVQIIEQPELPLLIFLMSFFLFIFNHFNKILYIFCCGKSEISSNIVQNHCKISYTDWTDLHVSSGIYWQLDVKCDSNVGPLVSYTDASDSTARGNGKHLFLSSY